MSARRSKPGVHEIVPEGFTADTLRNLHGQQTGGVRKACPNEECLDRIGGRGSLKIRRRASSEKTYQCNYCGHEFDDPLFVDRGGGE